jgi:hypothetical protein
MLIGVFMKNGFIAVLVLVLSSSAFARSIQMVDEKYESKLNHYNFDKSFNQKLNSGKGVYGVVAINRTNNTAGLSVYYAPVCPIGQVCTLSLELVLNTYELPIISQKNGPCGEWITIASKDARPVDGVLETITITDNKYNKCKTFIQLPSVQVEYYEAGYFRRLQDNKISEKRAVMTGAPFVKI